MIESSVLPIPYRDGDVRISTRQRSAGDRLLVLMHGFGCAKECFDGAFAAPELSGFALCAFDFPSHGSSSPLPPTASALEGYAEVASLVVQSMPRLPTYLVCHSMGGVVGLLAARRMPNLAGFVSVEGNLVGPDCGLVSRRTANQPVDDFVARGFAAFVADLRRSRRPDLRQWGDWYAQCQPEGLHRAARSLVELSDGGSLLGIFKGLADRAYVHGQRSHLDHVLPLLADERVLPIPAAHHFPMLDNPSAFYAVVADVVTAPRRRRPAERYGSGDSSTRLRIANRRTVARRSSGTNTGPNTR